MPASARPKKSPATKAPAKKASAKKAPLKRAAPTKGAAPSAGAGWTLDRAMAELERLGTDVCKKTYFRHGATEPLFGVRFGDLGPLAKRIGRNQTLAEALWRTGNFDAQNLAAKVADASALTGPELDRWLPAVRNYCAAMSFAAIAAQSPAAPKRIEKWITSRDEYTLACAYDTLGAILKNDAAAKPARQTFSDAFLSGVIDRIEKHIHASPNRARYSMNGALIGIGGWRPTLRAKALAAAKKIGRVEVDHGDTDCKTPDAVPYIEKMAARAAKKR